MDKVNEYKEQLYGLLRSTEVLSYAFLYGVEKDNELAVRLSREGFNKILKAYNDGRKTLEGWGESIEPNFIAAMEAADELFNKTIRH